MDCFGKNRLAMTEFNSVTLAFLGDAFYELVVRRKLAGSGAVYAADKLHHAAVRYVKASSQAVAMRAMIARALLSEEEGEIVRKARNRKPKTVPKNTDPVDYKLATALEALIGYHYSGGRTERAEAVAELAMQLIDEVGN